MTALHQLQEENARLRVQLQRQEETTAAELRVLKREESECNEVANQLELLISSIEGWGEPVGRKTSCQPGRKMPTNSKAGAIV